MSDDPILASLLNEKAVCTLAIQMGDAARIRLAHVERAISALQGAAAPVIRTGSIRWLVIDILKQSGRGLTSREIIVQIEAVRGSVKYRTVVDVLSKAKAGGHLTYHQASHTYSILAALSVAA